MEASQHEVGPSPHDRALVAGALAVRAWPAVARRTHPCVVVLGLVPALVMVSVDRIVLTCARAADVASARAVFVVAVARGGVSDRGRGRRWGRERVARVVVAGRPLVMVIRTRVVSGARVVTAAALAASTRLVTATVLATPTARLAPGAGVAAGARVSAGARVVSCTRVVSRAPVMAGRGLAVAVVRAAGRDLVGGCRHGYLPGASERSAPDAGVLGSARG